eukprot:6835420-Alexandrium_andersonii.AAC.1
MALWGVAASFPAVHRSLFDYWGCVLLVGRIARAVVGALWLACQPVERAGVARLTSIVRCLTSSGCAACSAAARVR